MNYVIEGNKVCFLLLFEWEFKQFFLSGKKPTKTLALCITSLVELMFIFLFRLTNCIPQSTNSATSGIPGGYRLVSTYDLPGCKTILKFEIWSFSNFFGGRGYSETLGFGLSDNFYWGGILKLSDLDSLTIFIGRGGILKLSDLDSNNFHLGGYSETLRFGLSDNFHLGGYSELQNREYSVRIWTKISTTPAGSCITDSLSHTTYVETNKATCDYYNLVDIIREHKLIFILKPFDLKKSFYKCHLSQVWILRRCSKFRLQDWKMSPLHSVLLQSTVYMKIIKMKIVSYSQVSFLFGK